MVKLRESKGVFFVSIPIDYIKLKQWKGGIDLIWTINAEGNLIIKELKK